ncbi:MAG: outer membrane lipoprotein carrier protein LolA [Deltaproteobacteria bacterium]|nr:outer membrane lipoprotein carrier protein LolA [Deltaproteobacteria bacterium]
MRNFFDIRRSFFRAFCAGVLLMSSLFVLSLPVFALTLEEILEGVERRYSGSGFSARFFQISTLKAMQITESASGRLYVKHPGKMRWEYEAPEKQVIITDGKKLWIYRPEDSQVMVGKAPVFFGEGKGAGFLSDIRRIRKNFQLSLQPEGEKSRYVIKLIPKKKTYDLAAVYLSILPDTFDVAQVITQNDYGDETRIGLSDFSYDQKLPDSLFEFQIPEGVDIVQMDE